MNRAQHYAQHREHFPGAPEDCPPDISEGILAKMSLPQNWGPWETFLADSAGDCAANDAVANVRCPLFKTSESPYHIEWPEDHRARLVDVCRNTAYPGTESYEPPQDVASTLEKLVSVMCRADVADVLRIPSEPKEDHTLVLVWSRVRCVLAGFGFTLWAPVCMMLQAKFPACPFDARETHRDWMKGNKTARHNCGWPLVTARITFRNIPAYPTVTGRGHGAEVQVVPDWLRIVALIHVMKHVRWLGEHEVDCMLGGRYLRVRVEGTNLASAAKHLAPFLSCAGEKSSSYAAVAWALGILERNDLHPRSPLGSLPGRYLVSDATRPVATGTPVGDGWYDHGMAMNDMFELKGNSVVDTIGDDGVVMDWRWNDRDIQEKSVSEARNKIRTAIPSSVPPGSPSTYLRRIFPNWRVLLPPDDWEGDEAAYLWSVGERAWFDAIICCDLVRSEVPALKREIPLVACLPAAPYELDSTNQGKTLFATLWANISVFGLEATSVPMSSSPPDTRVIVGILRRWGTACLDEFCIPQDQAHPLGRNQLAAMLTGGAATSGLVMENAEAFTLSHPLYLSSKVLDASSDIFTRTWPIFLDKLSEEARANMNLARDMNDGKCALTAKLMAWRLVQDLNLAEKLVGDIGLPTAPGIQSCRFFTHRACAAHLMSHYCQTEARVPAELRRLRPEQCSAFLDQVINTRQSDLSNHTMIAEQSGVLDQIRSGTMVRIPWGGLWEHLSRADTQKVLSAVLAHGQTHEVGSTLWIPVNKFLELYSSARDFRTARAMIETLTGPQGKLGQQALAFALSTCIRSYYRGRLTFTIDDIKWVPLPGGSDWEAAVLMQGHTPYLSFREQKKPKKTRLLDPVNL